MQTAQYWHLDEGGRVHCDLCPHRCVIGEELQGRCGVRGVRDGELVALSYGAVSSAQLDPIEKKPLYHFCPGHPIFRVGGWGCNLSCVFCQNWGISQKVTTPKRRYGPRALASAAAESIGIAYTYNEPCIWIEYVKDCATVAHKRGLKNVLVTNGHVSPEPAAELLPLVDALNIDIKSMDPSFYRDYCGGALAPVLAFAEQAVAAGCHVELTNLVIPRLNDAEDLFRSLADWVATALGQRVPLHLSAYHPQYKMDLPPTPLRTLERACEICSEQLDYVYIGNLQSGVGRDTACPGCGAALIRRNGFRAEVRGIVDGSCQSCGRAADVIIP